MAGFQYAAPRSLSELVGCLAQDPPATIIAGGTELVPRIKYHATVPRRLVSLQKVGQLRFILPDGGSLRIGAGITLAEIASSRLVRECAPALATVAGQVASEEVRNLGTIGGNVCQETRCVHFNRPHGYGAAPREKCFKAGGEVCYVTGRPGKCFAAYRGHLAPVLLALGAAVRIVSPAGERMLPLEALFSGDGRRPFLLGEREVLAEVVVPSQGGASCDFLVLSHRTGVDFPLVGVAAWVCSRTQAGHGGSDSVRVVVWGLGPSPVRARSVEGFLSDGRLGPEVVRDAACLFSERVTPVNNVMWGEPSYLRRVVPVLIQRCLLRAIGGRG